MKPRNDRRKLEPLLRAFKECSVTFDFTIESILEIYSEDMFISMLKPSSEYLNLMK